MRKYLSYCLAIVASSIATMAVVNYRIQKYDEYVRTSEELLHELETLCVNHDICWDDTVCEGDTWCDYIDARMDLGIGYFEQR